MSDGDFTAIDGNMLGTMCGVMVDLATIPYLLGSVKWLADEERYDGDPEDVFETVQAFESLARRLMGVTPDCEGGLLVEIPTGTIQMYMGSVAPSGWLFCDGSLVSSDNYPALAAVLGVSGAFSLPDMRARFPIGSGGGVGFSLTARTLGEYGGEESHALTLDEMPEHTHTVSKRNSSTAGSSSALMAANNASGTLGASDSGSAGVGEGHNNLPPFLAVNFIIKV